MRWNRRKADRTPAEATIVLAVSIATIRRAERAIRTCQRCDRIAADTPFRELLARVTGTRRRPVEYALSEPAHCPGCEYPIFEDTLVETA